MHFSVPLAATLSFNFGSNLCTRFHTLSFLAVLGNKTFLFSLTCSQNFMKTYISEEKPDAISAGLPTNKRKFLKKYSAK